MMVRRRGPMIAVALALCTQAAAAAPDRLAPSGRWEANVRGNAPTPPMGWNSWNAFAVDITEEKILGTAKALVDTGLARRGYRYVNIDDGWWRKRRQPDGRLLIRANLFPSADTGPDTSFRPFTDRLHAMGLKAGIYTDIGHNSCGQSSTRKSPNAPEGTIPEQEIGLSGHVRQDMKLYFGEWGFDYIKVDGCGIDQDADVRRAKRARGFIRYKPLIVRDSLNLTDIAAVRGLFTEASDAAAAANPDNDYVFALCLWGSSDVRAWGKNVGSVSRSGDDIKPSWSRMLNSFDSAATRPMYAGPNRWNDPDIMYVGFGEFDLDHLTEARSHFTLWTMIAAPLLIGYDMRRVPQPLLDIFGNEDLIRVDQDPGGHQAVIAYDSEDVQILVKTMSGTDRKIVAIVNRGSMPVSAALAADHLKFASDAPIRLRDLWSKKELAAFTGSRDFQVAPHETLVFEATGTRALPDGRYLSEIPGSINVAVDGVIHPEGDPMVHRGLNPWEGTRSGGERPVYSGWGGAQADAAPYAQTLRIAGTRYATGIGILGNSRMQVRNEGYRRFVAKVGVDANTRNLAAPLTFAVYGDGRPLARTEPLKFGDAPVALDADVTGVKLVELVVRQAGDGRIPASAAWADAALLRR